MKGLSHVAMGQFYEGIKAQTKVMLNAPLLGQKASSEYLKVKYLRGVLSLHLHPEHVSPAFSNWAHSPPRVLALPALAPRRPRSRVQRGPGPAWEL